MLASTTACVTRVNHRLAQEARGCVTYRGGAYSSSGVPETGGDLLFDQLLLFVADLRLGELAAASVPMMPNVLL